MSLIISKKLKDLQAENDTLRSSLLRINDKEEKLIRLEELTKKVNVEISSLIKQKTDLTNEVDGLKFKETGLKTELEKLNREIDKLREMKSDEQHNLLHLTNHINNTKSDQHPSQIKNIYSNDDNNNLYEKDIANSNDEIQRLEEKINNLKESEARSLIGFEKRIKELADKERSLQEKINLKKSELENLSDTKLGRINYESATTEDKLISLITEEQNLYESIKKKQNYLEEIELSVSSLKEEEQMLKTSIEQGKKELAAVGATVNSIEIQNTLKILNQEEQEIKGRLDTLKQTEQLKRDLISELNDKLSANEIKFAALEKDYEKKVIHLEEVAIKLRKTSGESAYKNKEILKLTEVVNEKNQKLKNLSAEISFSEEKINSLKKEIIKIEIDKTKAAEKYKSEKEVIESLKKDYIKLKEYLPILERRKSEIKDGNSMLESRFKNMFQVYNKELYEAGKKKDVLNQIIVKKEKDIAERDQVLFEKVAVLNETERVLKLRQVEISSFEDLLSVISEQTEMLKTDLLKLDDRTSAKRDINKQLDLEASMLKQRIQEFEKGLYVLLENSNKRFINGEEKRSKLESEIKEYEQRVSELNNKVKESMNELVELQESLGRIKIEHEEHRGDISKLVAMKKKMQEEIDKNQLLFDRYSKLKEKIKLEYELIKKRREIPNERELVPSKNSETILQQNDLSKIFKL